MASVVGTAVRARRERLLEAWTDAYFDEIVLGCDH
jgi:hypothetical protein